MRPEHHPDRESVVVTKGIAFYTWIVPDNKLYGDSILADFYGIPSNELARGIPVESVLARIVKGDRPLIAGNVHRAIVTGEPSNGAFRIKHPDGRIRSLVSFGRCFRDQMGVPSVYTGAVMDAASSHVGIGASPLDAHCRAALLLAERDGHELAARYLSSVLKIIASPLPES